MERNSEGKLIDSSGNLVFSNDIFNQMMKREHLYQISPSKQYADAQFTQVFSANPEDTRKFIDISCAKLIDDNASLASDDTIKNQYINDIICFAGIVRKILKDADQDSKNKIIGGLFATKSDNSEDSKIPMYLNVEILKAKCLKYKDTPTQNLDSYDVTPTSQVVKDSTLWQQLDMVIDDLKKLDFEKKDYFGDMSEDSINYLSACQIDPSGAVDIFAKCEDDKCDLYVTQGTITNNISMFVVEHKNVDNPIPTPNALDTPLNPAIVGAATNVLENPVAEPSVNNVTLANDVSEAIPTTTVSNDLPFAEVNNSQSTNLNNVDISYANDDLLTKISPRLANASDTFTQKKSITQKKLEELTNIREKIAQLKVEEASLEEAYKIALNEENVAGDEMVDLLAEVINYGNKSEDNSDNIVKVA